MSGPSTDHAKADAVYGDGEMPADADLVAPGSEQGDSAHGNDDDTTPEDSGGRMTDNAGDARDEHEPDGKFTDEEFADGSHTSDRSESSEHEGEYTDSELSETEKDRTERHD
ncbi:hypothetical protein [Frigoribacterium sp. UYMn621]|jgi:hypothetical protein|uniref:hypothetical protein n=1 Tax=Frigoribacterium sp. UYMn621 TaxID=3156343 RepID=UPI00339671FD